MISMEYPDKEDEALRFSPKEKLNVRLSQALATLSSRVSPEVKKFLERAPSISGYEEHFTNTYGVTRISYMQELSYVHTQSAFTLSDLTLVLTKIGAERPRVNAHINEKGTIQDTPQNGTSPTQIVFSLQNLKGAYLELILVPDENKDRKVSIPGSDPLLRKNGNDRVSDFILVTTSQ